MEQVCVVFDLTANSGRGPNGKPLMLEDVLFCPALRWCADAWADRGVRRFFVACDDTARDAVLRALPRDADCFVGSAEAVDRELALLPDDFTTVELSEPQLPAGGTFCAFHDLQELSALAAVARRDVAARHQAAGVSILDPDAVYLDPRAVIGAGTLLLPGTILRGECSIGENCELGPNTMVTGCTVGESCLINASQVEESTLGRGVQVGPYAHVRPNCTIGDNVKVGAYVEVKNAVFGEGTKMAHLTYVGDADVGAHVNFGCGTITSNYDGFKKSRTVIGDNVFVGCNTNLVPPVSVGDGAYIAAGTTVTRDVAPDALAIGRVRQEVKPDWARVNRELHKKHK